MDWYQTHGKNAEGTCRHFGISKSVFYRWEARYNPYNLKTLEDDKITEFEEIADKYKTDVKIISVETREGVQLRDMGKFAAVLRFEYGG